MMQMNQFAAFTVLIAYSDPHSSGRWITERVLPTHFLIILPLCQHLPGYACGLGKSDGRKNNPISSSSSGILFY